VTARARVAPGLRRLAADALPIKAQADRFSGLPDGLTPGQALAAFKRAAAPLGLGAVRDLADQLMAFSQPQDWQRGSRPIVWPGNAALCDRLGISERHLRRLLARLIEAGVIVPVDSAQGRRWGRRDSSGRIVEAYGFDLSPLADRHAEFIMIAEQAEEERKARTALRRRLTIARKAIQQLAETAIEHGLTGTPAEAGGTPIRPQGGEDQGIPGQDWRAWLAEARRIEATAAMEGVPIEEIGVVTADLERRRQHGETMLMVLLRVKESGQPDSQVRPNTTTTQPEADSSATCKPDSEKRSNGPGRPLSEVSSNALPDEPPAVTPRFVLRVSPPLQQQILNPSPTWADVVDAADRLRHRLGISRAAWIDACQVLGRYQAATAVAIIAAKQESIRSPGGYLRGMIARAREGDLHLLRSLHGLAEQGRQATAQHHP
jgi:replication initiation protein RepC